MALVRDESTVGGTARNRLYEYFEAQALGQIQSSLVVALIGAMAELASVVVAPREELGVAAVDMLKVGARSTLIPYCRSILLYVVEAGLVPHYIFGRTHSSLFVQVVAIGLISGFINLRLMLA